MDRTVLDLNYKKITKQKYNYKGNYNPYLLVT